MDFDDAPGEAAFRAEVRKFLDGNARLKSERTLPAETESDVQAARDWQARKAQAGLGAILLPKEYGGRGGTPIEQVIYEQEERKYQTPAGRVFMITFGMCIPTLIKFGRPEHVSNLAPAAINGDHIWCQLFSEPAGGSDLAGLRTSAKRRDDEWVVDGQKIWTSGAHYSDYGLLLARTDPTVPKHKGLTAFFVNMKTPGIEVRPIKQISGASGFNEVFFTGVVVPDSQRLGEPGEGWQVALYTLMNERVAVGRPVGPDFSTLLDVMRQVKSDGVSAIDDSSVRDWLAHWYCVNQGLKYTVSRVLTALSHGKSPGSEASILKVVASRQAYETAAFVMDLMGPAGVIRSGESVSFDGYFENLLFQAAGERIGGGTEEIMLNVIAERVLKLPPDPRIDKDLPFNKVATHA